MDANWLTPKAHVEPIEGKGWGAVADEPIAAGETVAAFGGWIVPRTVLDTLSEDRRFRSIQVDADLYLTSNEEPEAGDFLNHSCDPNCGMADSILLVAMRDIAPGEELTFDYAMCDTTDYAEFTCRCGTEQCRGVFTADDWQRPELIERYRGFHTTYVARRIADIEP